MKTDPAPSLASLPPEKNPLGGFGRLPSLLVRLALFSGSSGVAQLLGMLYSLLLARWLLPEAYGILAGCYAASTLTAILINWGMDTWLLHQASTDPEPLRLAGAVLKLKGAFGAAWAIGTWLILTGLRPDVYWPSILALAVLDTWLDACFNSLAAVLNATRRIRTISGLLVVSRGLRLASAVLLAVLGQVNILYFITARFACTLLILVAAMLLVKPIWRGVATSLLLKAWCQSFPYASSDFLAAIYLQIDVFLLSLLAGKTATGIYAPALGLINALINIVISAYLFFIPQLSIAYQNHPQRFLPLVRSMFAVLLAVGIAMTGGLIVAGPLFVNIFLRQDYQTTGILLQVMAPILFFKSIGAGSAAVLVAIGQQRRRLLPQFISAAANLLLNLWAIPRWGPAGAAMVYLTSEVILTAGYTLRVLISLRQANQA